MRVLFLQARTMNVVSPRFRWVFFLSCWTSHFIVSIVARHEAETKLKLSSASFIEEFRHCGRCLHYTYVMPTRGIHKWSFVVLQEDIGHSSQNNSTRPGNMDLGINTSQNPCSWVYLAVILFSVPCYSRASVWFQSPAYHNVDPAALIPGGDPGPMLGELNLIPR